MNTSKTPWRDGFWFIEKWPCYIFEIEGAKLTMKSWISLDYPDLGADNTRELRFGDFGVTGKGPFINNVTHYGEGGYPIRDKQH